MLQILQDLKQGKIDIADVPVPQLMPNHLLVASDCSLISKGTEKMLLDFGKANYLNKARQQPDKVKMVLNKVKTDGLAATVDAVTSKLNQPLPLGYSNVGRVVGVGPGVTGFSVGDRVVSNGHHAEVVSVPKNLCVKIPDSVSSEDAAFTVLGAIGLQGIRLADPTLGEKYVVTGLGLIGLITAQILKANGCQVLGLDFDPRKIELAKSLGIAAIHPDEEDVLAAAANFSMGVGVDGVIITASTDSNAPILQAAEMCRKKGRIVLVGVTGMELSRTIFFKKELSFQVSCSYGPGRYDPSYEEDGQDYPLPYVRWTEQRNFSAVLDLMAAGTLSLKPLVSHQFAIDQAGSAYDLISAGDKDLLGVLIKYPDSHQALEKRKILGSPQTSGSPSKGLSAVKVSFVGAGNYASRFLMPAFQKSGARFESVVTGKGVSSYTASKSFGFKTLASDVSDVFTDESDLVVIGTRHDTHGDYVLKSLEHNKHVFVEKPLAMNLEVVDQIESMLLSKSSKPHLMVGFNRRYSPLVTAAIPSLRGLNSPKLVQIKVNAGKIPPDHWTQDLAVGGRRLVGEGCHFIDLARHLVGHPISHFEVQSVMPINTEYNREDQFSLNLSFEDGSLANILYFSNGNKSVPKEFVEVHCDGMSFSIDNFRSLSSFGWKGLSSKKLWSQDKGQSHCIDQFVKSLKSGTALIPPEEVFEVARVSILAAEKLRQ